MRGPTRSAAGPRAVGRCRGGRLPVSAAGRLAGCAAFALLLGACTGTWGRSRTADLADSFPFSLGMGPGVSVSVRTPMVSIGVTPVQVRSDRIGYDDRLIHGSWREYQTGLPWSPWLDDLDDVPRAPESDSPWWRRGVPLMYRWRAKRDSYKDVLPSTPHEPEVETWGSQPPVGRETLGALLTMSENRAIEFRDLRRLEAGADDAPLDVVGAPTRGTLWVASRGGRRVPSSWDLFELDVFLFIGVRAGVRPFEFLDFLTGFVGLDLAGDDLPHPQTFEPEPLKVF